MTTREDYEAMVKGPGKFEGEPPWTPYFYDAYLNGDGELSGCEEWNWVSSFDITDEDRAIFPELETHSRFSFYETTEGFIIGKVS